MSNEYVELVVKQTERIIAVHRLEPGQCLIGRDDCCQIHIDGPGVSRRHAQLTFADGQAALDDLGSSHGTFVAGHKIAGPVVLGSAQPVQIGEFVLELKAAVELTEAAVQEAQNPEPGPSQPAPRYALGSEIARGGMGAVLSATDLNIKRTVAIKVALPAMTRRSSQTPRSAGFQLAVSRVSNQRPARLRNALPTSRRRHRSVETCATVLEKSHFLLGPPLGP